MKSTVHHTNSGIYKVTARETNIEKAVSKKIILLVIAQTVLFYLFSMLSSMEMQGSMNNIAIGGLLIAALTFGNLLFHLKWGHRTIEQKIASATQLTLPAVFAFVWVYMLI